VFLYIVAFWKNVAYNKKENIPFIKPFGPVNPLVNRRRESYGLHIDA